MLDRDYEALIERRIEKVRQLSDNMGYFERFFELCAENPTYRQAWESLEHEREEFGMPERYSSYESFKRGKSYHLHKHVRIGFLEDSPE